MMRAVPVLLTSTVVFALLALQGCAVEVSSLEQASGGDGRSSGGSGPPWLPGPAEPGETDSTCTSGSSAAVPSAFSTTCGGCHAAYGGATSTAPDLFLFQGSLTDFVARVREGKGAMPAFTEAQVSAPAVESIYAYFQRAPSTPGDESCVSPIMPSACSGLSDPLEPLFSQAAAVEPITETRTDGTLVLHGAGRVRGRHEQEAEFSPFHPGYFEKRSYRFTVEDSLPAGGSTVTFTWESAGKTAASPLTNFRYWYTQAGNVFHANVDMKRLSDTRYEWTVTQNEREKREIRLGDMLEFEFGVFLDPNAVTGRTNYYTDTFRYVVGSGKLTPLDTPDDEALSGASLTIPNPIMEPHLAFEQLALNIQPSSIQTFLEGRRLFHTDFSSGEHTEPGNEALTAQASKVGPVFNQASCVACHVHNGRGAPPEPGQPAATTVIKTFASDNDAAPHPDYGRQLQEHSVGSSGPEGWATVAYEEVAGTFPDGTPYSLRKPSYTLRDLSGAPVVHHSVRAARPLVGMGLLEAVPEEVLLERADEKDCNSDGISGRVNLVPEPGTGTLRAGRFGWKASKVSVKHQVADALVVDLGVTSSLFPAEDCGANQSACTAASAKTPELGDEDLERMTTYMRLLGVPARRGRTTAEVKRGEQLFAQAGCTGCHVSTLVTGSTHPRVELRKQVIHPYTDMLLHDMGEGLSDGATTEYRAGSSEWRTPPLWGLGLTKAVSGHTQLLHDGRARSTTEAILWHGGEAAAAKARFMAFPKEDRAALLSFLDSL